MDETNDYRLTLDSHAKICAEIYRNENGSSLIYSFVCSYCGDIYGSFEAIDGHISCTHYSYADNAYEDGVNEIKTEDSCVTETTFAAGEDQIQNDNMPFTVEEQGEEKGLLVTFVSSDSLPKSQEINRKINELVIVVKSEPNEETTTLKSKNKKLKCDICLTNYSSKHYLKHHLRMNTEENPYGCNLCEQCFAHLKSPKKLMPRHTLGINQKFECHICSKSVSTKHYLRQHIRNHTGDKPYSCQLCEKRFAFPKSLVKHIRNHSAGKNQEFKCNICSKALSSKENLTNHMRLHSGERPFNCNLCEKSFVSQILRKSHMQTHNTGGQNEKFKCDICSKSLFSKQNLNQHIRIHTGEKPYKRHNKTIK